ncbi:MAG: IclR family transcriptional regulator [Geobacteraceae bacterium]
MGRENSNTPNVFGGEVDETLEKDRQFVTALARGLELLRCFRAGEKYLGNREIAKRTGLPKPTVSRLTYTLTQLGYLTYSESMGKYSLGTAVLSLGYSFLSNLDIRRIARPMMRELADYSHASVSIGARDRLEIVYLENCRCNSTSFALHPTVGSHLPLFTTAIGRAYLCGIRESERDYLMDMIRLRDKNEWPKIKAGVEQAMIDYEEKGFCLSIGDFHKEISAVAVPYVPTYDSEVLSFNCGGPAFQLRRHMLEDDIGPHLVTLVRNVQSEMNRHH